MGEIRIKRDNPDWDNKPAHKFTNGEWKDIPTHHFINNRWQGELTSQSPLKFRADGEMLDWRIEGRTSGNLYPILIGEDTWNNINDTTHSNNNGELVVVMGTVENSGVYSPSDSAIRTVHKGLSTYSWSVEIKADSPANLVIGFENDGVKYVNITSEYQKLTFNNQSFISDRAFVMYNRTGVTRTVYLRNFMLNEGSTALPYEPYGGVGDWDEEEQKYRIPVRVESENLFNSETSTSVYLDVRGVEHPTKKSLTSDYISVNANTGYTLGQAGDIDSINDAAYCFYNSNKEFISSGTYTPSARGNIIRLLTPNDCAYFRFSYNHLRELVEFVEGQYDTLPPYSTTTTLYTDHQLMDGDSIDFSTTETTIPLATGNNTLTVDTAVKPSKVFVKFEG